jgi:hypothetical protein
MHYLKNLRATASSSYILSLCDGLCNRRLFASRPTNQRRSKKMTCTKSDFLVNLTTQKISIRKANKIKRWTSRISNPKFKCVFEIPENSLNNCSMWRVWGSLKAWTHAHSELNVRSCRREIQERPNHASVLPLINSIIIFIWIQRRCHAHRRWHGLELNHVKFLHQVLCELGLMYEGALLYLLNLDT